MKMSKKKNAERGLTIAELLIVVAIMGGSHGRFRANL